MSTVSSPNPAAEVEPRWGLGDAAVGWVLAYSAALLIGGMMLAVAGYGDGPGKKSIDDIPMWLVALQYPPLWLGFVTVPIWAAAVKGNGWVRDFRARFELKDVLIGVPAGLIAQLVLVPLVSLPILWLTDTDLHDLGEKARELTDKAHGSPVGVVLLFLTVVIGAPLAEELFFRGLVLRAFEKRWGTAVAVIGSSVVFGATHFEALQLVALTMAGLVFAGLAVHYGRLGPAVVAHMAFNGITVVNLVWKLW